MCERLSHKIEASCAKALLSDLDGLRWNVLHLCPHCGASLYSNLLKDFHFFFKYNPYIVGSLEF